MIRVLVAVTACVCVSQDRQTASVSLLTFMM